MTDARIWSMHEMPIKVPGLLLALCLILGASRANSSTTSAAGDDSEEGAPLVDRKLCVKNIIFNDADDVRDDACWQKFQFSSREREKAIEEALTYLHPAYSMRTHRRAFSIVMQCESTIAFPQIRKWLKEHRRDDREGITQVLVNLTTSLPVAPEWFDIFSDWIQAGTESASLDIGQVNDGFPALQWRACDEGARNLWTPFLRFIPEAELWRGYFGHKEAPRLQKEWREKLPKWLKEHPEARSYWIQQWHRGLKTSLALMVDEKAKIAMRKAIADVEAEFKPELADRRGICNDGK
jgi:hypothetical protein